MSDVAVALCQRLGGIARTSTLRTGGATATDLADAVDRGMLVKPRRGLYAVAPIDSSVGEALGHGGLLACVSAARRFGLWTLGEEDGALHVWVDPERHVRAAPACRCEVHRDHGIPGRDLVSVSVVHCLVQIAWCRGAEAFLCSLESALRLERIRDRDRAAIRRHVPAAMRWLVDFARSDADSGLETLMRFRLHLLGISCAPQVDIPGVGRVDVVIGDCLIVEADGKTHDGQQRHRDLVRDAVAAAHGFITLRFDSALILHEWGTVAAAILSVIARGLHEHRFGRRVRAGAVDPV